MTRQPRRRPGRAGSRDGLRLTVCGTPPDDDGGVQVLRTGHPRGQPAGGERRLGQRRLALGGLDQQVSAGRQPFRGPGGDPAQHEEPVRAAVQGRPRFVRPGLGREEPDLPGGDVGHVSGQYGDPAPQPGGQRLIQVSPVDVTPWARQVLPGAANRGRVDVGRVYLGPVHGGGQGRADRARAAAQVDDHVPRPGQRRGLPDEELGTPPRHEHAGRHGDPQAAELGPAEDVLQRQASDAPVHHGVEFVRRPRRGRQQPGFIFGEDTARGPEPVDYGIWDRH